jgi:hypothetical protein
MLVLWREFKDLRTQRGGTPLYLHDTAQGCIFDKDLDKVLTLL